MVPSGAAAQAEGVCQSGDTIVMFQPVPLRLVGAAGASAYRVVQVLAKCVVGLGDVMDGAADGFADGDAGAFVVGGKVAWASSESCGGREFAQQPVAFVAEPVHLRDVAGQLVPTDVRVEVGEPLPVFAPGHVVENRLVSGVFGDNSRRLLGRRPGGQLGGSDFLTGVG